MTETARFVDDDKDLNLPKVQATDGQTGYDVAGLLRSTGNVMLDPGFVNTASCESEITYIDGNNGVLRYRGYPIEQLAEHASFLETAFLVLYGDLPTTSELNSFEEAIRRKTLIDERMRDLFRCFPRRSHPMPVLSAGIMALSTFSGSTAEKDLDSLNKATLSLLAKVPTLAAFAYKNSMGQPTLYPDNSLGYVENFIRMSFGFPTEPYEFNEAITRGLEVLLILHADHEQNCSTSTVRMVASSGANLHAAVAAGVNALSGPKHGGANQAVVEMLQFIRDNDLTTKQFVEKVKNREDGVKLMGFGHRIYRNYDPRAAIIKKHADEILKLQTGRKDLLEIAKELEETALNDDYFKERKLYPNVDFYSGLIYEAMGFPLNMFTVLFAIGRLPGWIAQYREQVTGSEKIWRPRQIYTGCDVRDWIPFEQRS
ncbi:MAG: citrate synthase [Cutibacterium granulosum]|jgi:citrate (Si)-synthase|uniref:citrate synthase n=1 Tax=Cutibacterium granulosum TaxID=33011 RepID=UPI000DB607A4|nr:citrate synthase [Cutibacterium granulosum]MEA5636805.1 citrate synthase [Cutibacterium granulosum]MEA5641901.1 citrate synthase [Cutibacterium granulosum]MEA5646765.1 citrate synthase [Cutibacterium granulosum]PZP24360.1 MAG: citrate (Si)-synthase [Cutibacterium granulosum]